MRDEREAAPVPDSRPADHQHHDDDEHHDHEHHDHEHHDHTPDPRPNGGDPDETARVSPVDTATAEERDARVDDGARPEAADEEPEVTDEERRPDDLGDGELSDQELPPTGEPINAREPDAVPGDNGDADAVPTDTPDTAPEQQGLWDSADVTSLRERWREIQLHFVDDPGSAASDAAALVDEA